MKRRSGVCARGQRAARFARSRVMVALVVLVALAADVGCEETPRPRVDGGAADTGARDANTAEGTHKDTVGPPKTDGPRAKDAGRDTVPPQDLGGSFDGKPGEYTRSFGGRSYRIFVPAGYSAAKAIPLLLAFHGSGDSGANFYAFNKAYGMTAAAGPAKFILLVPDTKSPRSDFANWSGNPQADVPKMKQELGDLLALVAELSKHYRIDAKRVHALGFSNGGLFTAIGGFDRADAFASLTVCGYGWGGSGYPLVTPARPLPIQFLVGSVDSFASLAKASHGFVQGKGHPTRLLEAAGVGHKYSGLLQAHSPAKLFGWMATHAAP